MLILFRISVKNISNHKECFLSSSSQQIPFTSDNRLTNEHYSASFVCHRVEGNSFLDRP